MSNEIENIISHIQPFEDSLLVIEYIEKIEQQNRELINALIEINNQFSIRWTHLKVSELLTKYNLT